MTITQAIFLGIVQGFTEFFPISSSGHLVVIQALFGMKEPQVAFDIFLHIGSLVSILIFLRYDILSLFGKDRDKLFFVIWASIPTFIIGFLFKDAVEGLFAMPKIVGYMMVITGVLLITATLISYIRTAFQIKNLDPVNSAIIGIAQGIAIVPGISRSGATIATGLLTGLDRETAFRFSFLLAIPAILGASVVKAGKIGQAIAGKDALCFLLGGFFAMIVGLAAMKILLKIVRKNKLYYFGIYCIIVGIFIATRIFN